MNAVAKVYAETEADYVMLKQFHSFLFSLFIFWDPVDEVLRPKEDEAFV